MINRHTRPRTPQAGSVQRRSENVRNAESESEAPARHVVDGDDTRNAADTSYNPAIPTGFDNPRPTGEGTQGRPQGVDSDTGDKPE